MNRNDLIAAITSTFGGDKQIAALAVGAVLDAITENVAAGEKVAIHGFGSFELVHKPERGAVNPSTREPVTVPESWTMKFKPASALVASLSEQQKASVAA